MERKEKRMYCTREVTKDIIWVGGNDRRLALFENLFPIPDGVSYNSYVILDEKTAVMDTVDASITRQFIENVEHALGGRKLDYLVINHMEPDHCATIGELLRIHPELTLVGNEKTFRLISQFYDIDMEGRTLAVKEGDTLCLGKHTLHFVFAPMVHWPEVMMAYEESEKILFAADAFGSFGAHNGALFSDEVADAKAELPEMRRYYGNIVGKYGPQVQAVLKKAAGLDIAVICPLHGLIWRGDFGWVLEAYDKWSKYEPEEKSVAVFYASMYGDTQNAAEILAGMLAQEGVKGIRVYDVSKTHVSYLISEVFRCSHLVMAAPTYNNGLYPAMENLLTDMAALNLQNRTVGLIANGSWAPQSGKIMDAKLSAMKNMRVLEGTVTLHSSLKEEQTEELAALCRQIVESL